MTDKSKALEYASKLVQEIQTDEKIGSAYDRYNIEYLWDLGEGVQQYREFAIDKRDTVSEILTYLQAHSIRCLPLLLKNAETTRRVWKTRADYLRTVEGVSYGKLKAILPILDPEFSLLTKVPRAELDSLLQALPTLAYKDVLDSIRNIRRKYDPAGPNIDYDELYSNIYAVTERLTEMATKPVEKELKMHRANYSSQFVDQARRLISALKSEEMNSKLAKDIPPNFPDDKIPIENDADLIAVIRVLSLIRKGKLETRETLRQRIGISRLGELSTVLKALMSREELERFARGRKLIEQIRIQGMNP